jgi:hypothetical protein
MRKWLVKNFVLDYMFKLFGKTYNAPRASRIIFPIFVITGLLVATNPDWPTPTPLIWLMYLFCATSLFFGFVYFKIKPAKWEELDKFQKFQYGAFKINQLTPNQLKEYLQIYKEYVS